MNHLVSIGPWSRDDIEKWLSVAAKLEEMNRHERQTLLRGEVLVSLFFEPSTRTRLSFESAAIQLGAGVVGFSDAKVSSTFKGESLEDTIRTASCYGSALVIRHSENGSAARAARVASVPIVNAGDGSNEHPTQTLLDLYSIQRDIGRIDGLKIGFCGDLKYGRTVHSLLLALAKFRGVEISLISPPELTIDDGDIPRELPVTRYDEISEVLQHVDALYMTRVQRERLKDPTAALGGSLVLDAATVKNARRNLRIYHPLPRTTELLPEVDALPQARYFEQVRSGIPVRQAVLLWALEKSLFG